MGRTAPWIVDDALAPRYEPATVCFLAEMPAHTLQNWRARGLLKPDMIRSKATRRGKGGTRLYSKTAVCALAIAYELAQRGFEAARALIIASHVVSAMVEGIEIAERAHGISGHDLIMEIHRAIAVVDCNDEVFIHAEMVARITSLFRETSKKGPTLVFPIGTLLARIEAADHRHTLEAR